MKFKSFLAATALMIAAASCCNSPETPVYLDESKPLEERVEDAL